MCVFHRCNLPVRYDKRAERVTGHSVVEQSGISQPRIVGAIDNSETLVQATRIGEPITPRDAPNL